jgi:molybdopterin/thiamine biosynthesis adenylyltransferase
LIDPDVIDTPSNLRRIVGSRPSDLITRLPKVEVLNRHLAESGYRGVVARIHGDVRLERAAHKLLECDVVVSATDTQSSRALINQLAVQYWLPTIDIGVRVGTSLKGQVSGMPAEVRVLLPDGPCLWCVGALNSDIIRTENLPDWERERLAYEGYVQGLPDPQPSLAPLNFLAGSLAVTTMLRLVVGDPLPATNFVVDGWEQYWHPLRQPIRSDCICHQWRGLADIVSVPYLPPTLPNPNS